MKRLRSLSLLLLGGALLTGCDSSYHAFDGQSGFSFAPLSDDQYQLEYRGDRKSSAQDVETMWHHAARELCRSGLYQHAIYTRSSKRADSNGGNIVPDMIKTHQVKGEVFCLAPNFSQKVIKGDDTLLGKNLAADHFKSRSATD